MATVNNGVNVQALLDAREAPEGRSRGGRNSRGGPRCKWENGTYSKTFVHGFFGLGEEQKHKTETSFEADHPEIFASEDRGIDADRIRARRPRELPHGRHRRGRAEPRHPAPLGQGDARRPDGHPRHPRHRQRRAQRLRRHQGDVRHRRRRVAEDIEAIVAQSQKRSAVYDVITNPTNVTVEADRSNDDRSGATVDASRGRHRRRPCRPRGEPVPDRAVDRPRRPRARARWPTPGGTSAGTRCACSRRTGRAACRAMPTTAPIRTAT